MSKYYKEWGVDKLHVPKDEWLKGVEIEKEHTDDEKIAAKIALDHLHEDSMYYYYLVEAEEKMKRDRWATLGMAKGIFYAITLYHQHSKYVTQDEILYDLDKLDSFTRRKYIVKALESYLDNKKEADDVFRAIEQLSE